MTRNFHLKFITDAKYIGTALETAAREIEELIVAKSHAICDDSIDWDGRIKHAQAELAAILKRP